ncbi:PEP-CTERM sorting domain-containing protein [Accumulibacter sp.]|uniref:PEP-CTERM sorting domain-containing protein n=1 Tax=Accumulibacter sp. TaxID=2053492 RepID=UPI00260C7BB0|nr:PEP-CTERM sorting domain-containing protein [Accumulibacter sp.]
MKSIYTSAAAVAALLLAPAAGASLITFEAAGANPAAISPARDAFRTAVGGGSVAGANGSFGGLRREINWDGVPDPRADPNPLPGNFFNVNSPRGAVFSTPGSGFLVSANADLPTPTLFGFPGDLQTFSAQRLFTAVESNITDVTFFVPGTGIAATTSAFGAIFVDVELPRVTRIEFFDATDTLLLARDVLVGGNQGLSFVGAVAKAGEKISRVRLTSGANAILSNGVRADEITDMVVMDDFLYAEPTRAVPEPSSLALAAGSLLLGSLTAWRRRRPSARSEGS